MKVYKTRPFSRDGSPAQTAALERQLRGLIDLEQNSEVYQALCAAATERRRADDALPRRGNNWSDEVVEARRTGRTHGLIGTYNDGCRCDGCRKASADYRRMQRAKAAS